MVNSFSKILLVVQLLFLTVKGYSGPGIEQQFNLDHGTENTESFSMSQKCNSFALIEERNGSNIFQCFNPILLLRLSNAKLAKTEIYSDLSGKCYVQFSQSICRSLEVADIIFPFHSFW